MIRGILTLFGSLISNSAEEILPPSDSTSSEGVVEVQLRLYNGMTLLIIEYKLRVLPQSRQQTLAQLFAKLLSVAALNKRLGYYSNVHGVVTDLKETVFYTYNPRSGKFSMRGLVHIGGCNRCPRGQPVSERVAFQQMMALVTRFMLNLLLEGYSDYMEEALAKCQLPASVVPSYIETLRLAEWDAHAYEARMRSSVSLPDGETVVVLTPQQRLIVVTHTYLSHLGFKCQSGTSLTLQDSNGVNGTLLYTLEGIDSDTMQFALEASYKPLPASNAFDCYIQMYCVQRGELPFSDCDRISCWHFLFSQYFDVLPHLNNRRQDVGHAGFLSSVRGGVGETYREFTNDLFRHLLCPLWDSVKVSDSLHSLFAI
ncbi:hypothetical protein ARMGADRAFT_495376 [Armillaria gallica]|uniref:Uncharacterized protein n=1 Tax=Armillaria gallica TaxID=47427 RepID=A0A2H3DYT7_ARMGA|nr:hypothetical protein ARMGADRAFT_495376 [Armillaria gallica]